MLRIRLIRGGRKKLPYYRVIVVDKRRARNSRKYKEDIGYYNPLRDRSKYRDDYARIDMERFNYWLNIGAQPSDRVKKIISFLSSSGDHVNDSESPDVSE